MSSSIKPVSQSDLASLWTRAIIDYKSKTGYDLTHMKAASMDGIMQSATSSLESFQGKLHNKGKVDKVRTAFGNNLDGMRKCMSCISAVGAAAGAFPPAMPVGIIFAACGRVLDAFAGVRADHDKVVAFFNQSSRFFERLSIIEGKVKKEGPLATAIVRVFSAQLSICALAESKMSEKNARIKAFLSALWTMEDPDLAASYGVMQVSIEELAQSVGYQTYSEIKDVQTATGELSEKADEIDEAIRQFRAQQTKDLQLLYEGSLDLKAELTIMRSENKAGFSLIADKQDAFHSDLKDMFRSLRADREKANSREKEKSKSAAKGTGKGDGGDKKFAALTSIKTFLDSLPETSRYWKEAHRENTAQEQDMKENYVPKTGLWMKNDPAFQDWVEGKNPLLVIKGPEGIGKSFISHASLRLLRSQEEGHASFGYFYFKEDFAHLQFAQCAFSSAALQIAESSAKYAEQIAAKLKEDEPNTGATPTWRRFFLSPFGSSNAADGNDKLFLVFDGLDESNDEQRQIFYNFLEDLKKEKSRVHVLVTTRNDETTALEELNPLVIEASKAKMLPDIKILIWSRLQTLGRLRKFSVLAKKQIRRKVAKQADGMLYVEHTLRRLSYIGREGAVVRALDKLPDNLHDLYKIMLDDCRRNRTPQQYEALCKLFAWLAFSKRALSLAEASELVKLTVSEDDDFDIEDEIVGRSARILELTRTRIPDEDAKDDLGNDEKDDADEEYSTQQDEYQNAPLTFQERSLRQYFRAVSVETHGNEDIRTPAADAHLIILSMCVDVLMKSSSILETTVSTEQSKMADYAVKFWHEHFNELDPETLSDAQVGAVLKEIYKVVGNKENVARLFEILARVPVFVYPTEAEGEPTPWYVRLVTWAKKSETLPSEILGSEIKEWLSTITTDEKSVLAPLARGHVKNWLSSYNTDWLLDAHTYAEAALSIMGRYTPGEDRVKEVLAVADAFGPHDKNPKAARAIGTRILEVSYDQEDVDLKKKLQDESLPYMTEAIDTAGNDTLLISLTYRSLTRLNQMTEQYDKSIEYADKSIEIYETSKTETDSGFQMEWKRAYWVHFMYIYKAECLFSQEKKDEALAMYREARRTIADDDQFYGDELDPMTKTLDDNDPDGHRLMDELKDWTEKQRHTWFRWCFEWWTEDASLTRLFRAANLSSQTSVLFEWFSTYEKSLPPRSLALFNLKASTADLYRKYLKDIEKAKEAMRAALAIQPSLDSEDGYVFHYRISAVRLDLAGVIFEQFRSSPDPIRKEACVEEMKALLPGRTDQEFRESHIDMLVANMLRIMGPAREYQKYLDQIFKTCIDGLEDGVSWNDGDSLRLLAKVLASLEGLERDARITISSQFSVLDRTIFDSERNPRPSGSEDGDTEGVAENGDKVESTSEGDAAENPDTVKSKDDQEAELANGAIPKSESVPEAETKNSITASSTEVSPLPTTDIAPTSNGTADGQVNGEPKSATNGDSTTTDETQPTPSTDDVPAAEKEDLCDYGIGCDGCGTGIQSWTQPFYLCLICPNIDLCEACHEKRTVTGSEISYCADNHHYIKGAMKGWKGIKDGVIRIADEEIQVKDWIKGLKEERWPKAWEVYWKRQGGLKDIGDE